VHELSLRGFAALEFAEHFAFREHEHAIGQAEDFLGLAGRHQDSHALGREFLTQLIDLPLCANVDTACRIVEDQDCRIGGQPFRQENFLLVATAEVDDFLKC
jgi:hypothetical protein